MFDKTGFIAFVGSASGLNYANGLENIEKAYIVDIDTELLRDQCADLLRRIDSDKKTMTDNDKKNRQNWYSHLRKYVEYCDKKPVDLQKQRFAAWLKQQPQRNNPAKLYSDVTVNAAVSKLQNGLKTLGVSGYENTDCFTITDIGVFRKLYMDCYAAATESDKELGHSDFRNGLDFYLQFLEQMDGVTLDTALADKIRFIIGHYKANFITVGKQEQYKWEAIQWYKQHWNLAAPDFAAMVKNAFAKTKNLLNSGPNSQAYTQICQYAMIDAARTKDAFIVLYNEELPLGERILYFQKFSQDMLTAVAKYNPNYTKKLSSFQDLHAISVYLYFEYPEKYFIYKARNYEKFAERVGFEGTSAAQSGAARKLENLEQLSNIIIRLATEQADLMALHAGRMNPNCYPDKELHLLAQDIVYYGSRYMEDYLFVHEDNYWPTLEDYDPGITKDMWLTLLQDESVTTDEAKKLLNMFLELGGESTFQNLKAYFDMPFDYKDSLQDFGSRVINKVNCTKCPKEYEEFAKYIIPFVGRMVMDGDIKRDSWKLRAELKEALEQLDFWPTLAQYDLKLTKDDWKKYIQEIELPNHPQPMQMLKALMEQNGQASCKRLSELYGGTPNRYVGCAMNLGRRAKKYFDLPACMDDGQERLFAIPFVGKRMLEGGKEYYVYRMRPELFAALKEIDLSGVSLYVTGEEEAMDTVTDVGLNTILYGPPGTGKTYHTVIYAVAIIENKKLDTVKAEAYHDVLNRYNEYKAQGRIEFTTFHQSYGYEEFIEGIKPVVTTKEDTQDIPSDIQYKVQSGAFKMFCERADQSRTDFIKKYDKLYYDKKGKGGSFEVAGHSLEFTDDDFDGWFGDDDVYDLWRGCCQIRSSETQEEFSDRKAVMQAVIDNLIDNYGLKTKPEQKGNCVFIIDEINRGNISKIFGELITLIEESKRVGKEEGMKTLLPYSMKPFGVPENVYIIGTMNTADRSIATIDTALRRRFEFKEMLPDPEVVAKISVGNLSIKEMLTRMNRRIAVLYDREHTIGHAYFMPLVKDNSMEKLAEIFKNKVIPLLQEYFYEDYEKIRLVLGDNQKKDEKDQFILRYPIKQAELFGSADVGLDDGFTYEINEAAFLNMDAYQLI